MINYRLSCLEYFHFAGHNSFSSIFLYLISCTKLSFEFFSFACRFSARSLGKPCFKSVGKHCFKQHCVIAAKYHQNKVYLKCFSHSILTLTRSLLLTYQLICFFAHIYQLATEEKKHNSGSIHITPQDQTYYFNY